MLYATREALDAGAILIGGATVVIRKLRTLNVIDMFTRECLGIEAASHLRASGRHA